jgi:cytochrome P450
VRGSSSSPPSPLRERLHVRHAVRHAPRDGVDPGLIKALFHASNDQLHVGEANALVGPILGERSVLLLDRAEHLRHRRLLAPPFHGPRMLAHAATIRECTDTEIDSWPVGSPFALLGSLQSLTLRVILRAVFGYQPGAVQDELCRWLRAMVKPLSSVRGLLTISAVGRGLTERNAARDFRGP